MADFNVSEIIDKRIAFEKSSSALDINSGAMRTESKNCTVLMSDTCSTSDSVVLRDQEEGSVSSSSSDIDSGSVEGSTSLSGLRMIRMAYGRRNAHNPSASPPPRGIKRLRMSTSSPSSSRSSSASSLNTVSESTSGTSVSTIKMSGILDGSHKTATLKIERTSSAGLQEVRKSPKRPNAELSESPKQIIKLSSSRNTLLGVHSPPPIISGRTDEFDQKPSTSKGIQQDSSMRNGMIKAPSNIHDNSPRSTPNDERDSHLNGKILRKRVLSERGEMEARYPVIDRRVVPTSWRGSRILRPDGRNAGIGLYNQSNDCFLNVVLQLMVHTAPLARYVAELHQSLSCVPNCFICALGAHVRRAISSPTPFKAHWIHSYLRKIFPTHLPGLQEDAHELLNLLLDAIDTAAKANQPQTETPPSSGPLETPRLSTPVEQIFGGTVRNQIRCFDCSNVLINYERIRELNVGLKMKNREGPVCMVDLLTDYFGAETLNSFECIKCNRKTHIQRYSRILRAPFVLMIQLKRFNSFGAKIRLPVSIDMNLHLEPFMYQSNEPHLYQLCGLIEHQGAGLDHGHYVAAVRGFDGKNWHLFDDEISQRISIEDVQRRQAYLLLYIRRDVNHELSTSHSFSSSLNSQQADSPKRRIIKRQFGISLPLFN